MNLLFKLLKSARVALWNVRDFFKVVWFILLCVHVRLWKMPKRTHRPVRAGEKLRVCIVSEYYYPTLGGVTEHIYNFARKMLRLGHSVTLVTSNAGDSGGRGEIDGLRIFRLGRSHEIYSNGSIARVTFSWRIHRELEKIFRENAFDVVHVHSPITPTLPLLVMKYATCPVVGTFHTDFDKSRWLAIWRRAAQLVLDNTDAFVAVSPVSVRSMERYMDCGDKFVVIPNGIDTEWFYRRESRIEEIGDGRPNILYIGRFDPRNGFSTMARAFALVKERVADARLVVIGYGPLQDYYLSKIPEHLRRDIVFAGKTDLTRPQYYSSCHVLCVPAVKAACSVAILEALATKIPIVASGIDGFKWIIAHEKEALLVPDFEPRSYADAITRVLGDPALRERMTAAGHRKARTLDWSVITQDVLKVYYGVLEAAPADEKPVYGHAPEVSLRVPAPAAYVS